MRPVHLRATKAALTAAFLFAALLPVADRAAAQTDGLEFIARKDIPKAVADAVECGTEPDTIWRQPFAGGFLFRWDCPGNNANMMQALVFATREDGADAKLLRFPGLKAKESPFTEISNVRLDDKKREVGQIFVDGETGDACRSEARWRLTGETRRPQLIYWRWTRDCDGKRGWRVVLDKRGAR